MVAGYVYSKEGLVDWRVVRWSVAFGVPATVVGALLTRWVSGGVLVKVTDLVLVGLGLRLLLSKSAESETVQPAGPSSTLLLASVAVVVGLASGLLANKRRVPPRSAVHQCPPSSDQGRIR